MTGAMEIKEFLANEIITAMYMSPDELDEDALFSSYGLESTTLVKILKNINDKFSTEIKIKDILPHQSVNRATHAIQALLEGEKA